MASKANLSLLSTDRGPAGAGGMRVEGLGGVNQYFARPKIKARDEPASRALSNFRRCIEHRSVSRLDEVSYWS